MPHENESKIIVEDDALDDVPPTTHCDDDNCYTIGAIHTINDESDYAYDMKRPKLGDAMLDEDDVF